MAKAKTKPAEVETPQVPAQKKYRLLAGKHNEGGVTYSPGQVFLSSKDVLKFNRGAKKFALVSALDDTPVIVPSTPQEVSDAFTDYTIEELRIIAEDEEIDLTGLTTKAEISKAIEAAQASA